MSYDLRADVKAILDETSLADPGEIADKVAESIPPRALRDALHVTLRSYVRQVISESRTNTAPSVVGRSAKVAAIRDGWQRRLHDRCHVGGSVWKLLGECDYADLYAMADEREHHAATNAAWARHYRSLAALLTEHDAAVVSDLPPEVLMRALGTVA